MRSALAEFAHVVAPKYPINVALHTDHCPKDKLDSYVRPLLEISQARVDAGQPPLFQSHMWDGSAVPLEENLEIAKDLLAKAAAARIILEIEVGVVGGEEDGVEAEINEKLYTTRCGLPRHARRARRGRPGRPLPARGDLRQCARRLQARQREAAPGGAGPGSGGRGGEAGATGGFEAVRPGLPRRFGLGLSEIREALSYGVVKMNVDTDTQYAFTREIVGHMFTNYDGVLKVDGEVGNKKAYDPRSYLQGGRGRDGGPRRHRVRGPALGREVARRLSSSRARPPLLPGPRRPQRPA